MSKVKIAADLAQKAIEKLGGTQAERMARAAEQGYDTGKVWYHGANRLDRLLEKPGIQSKRATSGPMPFFTDNPEIASNYASGKVDTSRLADYDFNYSDWFKVKVGKGKPKRLDDAWYYLSPDEKQRITESISKVTADDNGVLGLGDGPGGKAHWDYVLKEKRGNALAAARDIWLDSANLFNEEERFLDVLRMGGLDKKIIYDSPQLTAPGVLPVYAKVTNPLNTADPNALSMVQERLVAAAKGKRSKSGFGVDQWDKNTIGIREFNERLADDIKNGTSHAWTSIPDDVTNALKGMGFDGILDTGGKNGGVGHRVLIPFDPSQVRSVNADFNPANASSADLLAGIQSAAPIGAGALLAGAALAPEDAEAGVITKGGKRIIEAWHGSPHLFDRFDVSKIGTGEGAQAYGHGLYFADAPETAKAYREQLSDNIHRASVSIDGQLFEPSHPSAQRAAAIVAKDGWKNARATYTDLKRQDLLSDDADAAWKSVLDATKGREVVVNPGGSLYRTHIDVDPDTLLDWDKPLSEQPEAVRNALGNPLAENFEPGMGMGYGKNKWQIFNKQDGYLDTEQPSFATEQEALSYLNNPTGADIYQYLAGGNHGPAQAEISARLKSNGIPGIRYRDQMSRGDTAEPTFNYVIFDDKPISIVERGMATPTALGATAAATGGTMAALSPEAEQYRRDAAEAAQAAQSFAQRRAGKAEYWKQKREQLLGLVDQIGGAAIKTLDMPLQGYMGLSAVAGRLASGDDFSTALQQGGRVAAQPTDATAYEYGLIVTDQLSPYVPPEAAAAAGALVNAGSLLGSPL